MKNYKFLLTLLCLMMVTTGFSEWVLLNRQQASTTNAIQFIDFVTDDYEDYVFVIDMMEPLGGYADVAMQFSTNSGGSWLSSYNGGLSSVKPGDFPPVSVGDRLLHGKKSDSNGIPVTDVANAGYYFIGHVHLSNATGAQNLGPLSIYGGGRLGSNDTIAQICGSINAIGAVDSVQFVSTDPVGHPTINRASVTLYGLKEW